MNLIPDTDTIPRLIKQVKDVGRGFLTNFYPDTNRTNLWIKLSLLSYDSIGSSIFLYRKNRTFSTLYYISPDFSLLSQDIKVFKELYPAEIFVIDILGKEGEELHTKDLFQQNGYFQYTKLARMNKIGNELSSLSENSEFIKYANPGKIYHVYNLLQEYFDPYAEQLPLLEEIEELISNKRILIYSEIDQIIQGFLIFELIGQTSYLRYWFVHPEFRDKKVGSGLLRRFFAESELTKRQLFWVIESNDNAIKRYEHYGFRKEGLIDYVLINKEVYYGR